MNEFNFWQKGYTLTPDKNALCISRDCKNSVILAEKQVEIERQSIINQRPVNIKILLVEADEDYFFNSGICYWVLGNGFYCNFGGPLLWEAINPGADIGEGNRFQVIFFGQFEGIEITILQQFIFIIVSSAPYRANGMNDEP